MSLLTNLISYWKMDEASGNALDANGGATLTDVNTVTSAAGKISTARQFTNANGENFEAVAAAEWQSASDKAVSLWMNAASFAANAAFYTGLLTVGKNSDMIWSLSLVQNVLRLEVQNSGGSYQSATYSTPLSTGTWYHVVGELNAGTLRLYVNGSAVASAGFTGSIKAADGTTHKLAIGRDYYTNDAPRFYDGLIDEVGLWSGRGLTSTEATDLYNGGAGLAYSSFGGAAAAAPQGWQEWESPPVVRRHRENRNVIPY